MSKTHYEVLGVDQFAGGAKIKRSYYELCKKYHPDVTGGSAEKMVAINEAYRVLSDATLKSAYDHKLAAARRNKQTSARAAQTAPAQQPIRKDAAPQTTTQQNTAFSQATRKAAPKNKSVWGRFIAFVSAAAILTAISYALPTPKTAIPTTDTPTAVTTDPPAAEQTSSTTTNDNTTSDQAAQDALNTLQSDTGSSTSTPPASSSSTPTTPTTNDTQPYQTTHKHHHPISLWYND